MRRFIAIIVLAGFVAGACSSPEPPPVGARQAELAPGLLTLEEIRNAPGAPGGLNAAEDGRIAITQDADTRGPCGATVDQVPFDGGAVALFGRPDVVIVHLVLADTGTLAENAIRGNRADLTPGCPPYTKATPSDGVQTTELIREIDLGNVGDDRFAFLIRGSVEGSEPVFGTQALVRSQDDLSALIVFSSEAIDDAFVQELSRIAAERLGAWRS